jgi:hypothetical protein
MTHSLDFNDNRRLLEIARDPNASAGQLELIAEHLALAANSNHAPPSSGVEYRHTLERQGLLSVFLDRKPPSELTAALLLNPNTPQKYLLRFAADFPDEILNNPILPLLLLENPDLFRHMNPLRLLVFLRHATISHELLGAIQASAQETVADTIRLHVNRFGEVGNDWRELAQNELSNLPLPSVDRQIELIEHLHLETISPWLMERLQQTSEEHIKEVLHNPLGVLSTHMPMSFKLQLHQDYVDPIVIKTASRNERRHAAESTNPTVLQILADDSDPGVRARVARNPNTPIELLPTFEQDDSQFVRAALAENPMTPDELLEKLASDYSWSAVPIRLAVVRHPNTPPSVLHQLVSDDSTLLRQEVARLPGLSADARRRLQQRALTHAFYSNDLFLHCIAMSYVQTHPQQLVKGAHSPFWQARYALANNPSIPAAALNTLTHDGNVFVRAAAKQQLHMLKDSP